MLCYLTSRNAAQLLHDTFAWIGYNRRTFGFVAMFMATVCMLAALLSPLSDYVYLNEGEMFESWIMMYSRHRLAMMIICAALTFVTSYFVLLIVYRYFVERRAVRDMFGKSVLSVNDLSNKRVVLTAVMCSITMALLILLPAFLAMLVFVASAVLLPCALMGTTYKLPGINWLARLIKGVLAIALVVAVFIYIPYVLSILGYFVLQELMPVVPGMHALVNEADTWLFPMLFTGISFVSVCAAVAVFLVAALLLHGSIFTPAPPKM